MFQLALAALPGSGDAGLASDPLLQPRDAEEALPAEGQAGNAELSLLCHMGSLLWIAVATWAVAIGNQVVAGAGIILSIL